MKVSFNHDDYIERYQAMCSLYKVIVSSNQTKHEQRQCICVVSLFCIHGIFLSVVQWDTEAGIKAACGGHGAIQFTIHISNPIDEVISKVDTLMYEHVDIGKHAIR